MIDFRVIDPVKFCKLCWPGIDLYNKQREILYSIRDNNETVVPAGNMLGKDFVAALGALWFFISRHPCRVVTTSVDGTQLESVLWGEIRRFIQQSKYTLPLVVNHLHLRKVVQGQVCGLSYLLGRVAAKGEGLLGHHIAKTGDGIPRTLFVADEASGVEDISYERADTWAERKLIIGNPYGPYLGRNFFFRGVQAGNLQKEQDNGNQRSGTGGDRADSDMHGKIVPPNPVTETSGIRDAGKQGLQTVYENGFPGTQTSCPRGEDNHPDSGAGYYRRVIRIKAEDSPNVRAARLQIAKGETPTGEMLVPGVLSWSDYQQRRALWDKVRQCIGLDAEFYEGAETLLFPPDWLNHAELLAAKLGNRKRIACKLGIDTAQGGDYTAWCVIDELGVIDLIAKRTPNTAVITGETLALMRRYNLAGESVLFDAGGGGREHADRLRSRGYNVQTVAFGAAATPTIQRGRAPIATRRQQREIQYAYHNKRAELYGLLRQRLDPDNDGNGFAIPARYVELRRQLAPIPLDYDGKERLVLPPKTKRDKNDTRVTLTQLIGRSPDEADALVLAVYGLAGRPVRGTIGVGF